MGIRIRAALVTGLLACAMLISPTSQDTAGAVFPGVNGRIAFQLDTFGQGSDVWTVNPDGTGLRQVTRNGVSGSPRWAPSGRSIAFLRGAPGREAAEVWTIRPNGTGARRVTTGVAGGRPPAWSPRGNELIVIRPVGRGSDLFRVPLTGGRGQRLTYAAARGCDVEHPSWRADVVVYARHCTDTEQLRLLNLSTGVNRLVFGQPAERSRISWPDFTSDLTIMFMSCGFSPWRSGVLSHRERDDHQPGWHEPGGRHQFLRL